MNKYIFISDNFVEDYCGGAELSSEALINKNKGHISKIKSSQINEEFIEQYKDNFWIFGNFAQIDYRNILKIIKSNINYSIVEYDLKFCKFRSPQKHRFLEGKECDCHNQYHGKLVSIFFSHAKHLWFMSLKQKQYYENKFSFLKDKNSYVLSSIFDESTLDKIKNLPQEKDNNWIILNSPSWIKNSEGCIEYANKNNLSYELIWGMEYSQLLSKLAQSKGLIFLPLDKDTCPRIVIEAKLLGCDLKMNENVLHKEEEWFNGTNEDIFGYLGSRADFFWNITNQAPPQ